MPGDFAVQVDGPYFRSKEVFSLHFDLYVPNISTLFKRVELGQETIKSKNEVLPFFVNDGDHKIF